ncbi:MAG: stage III sporulation protein AB [Ruminococcaceae bacterium]|nr:stage III sporulation protein AB [Oscillospiraceae bacterium]
MTCAWQPLLNIMPPLLRADVDRFGRDELLELRLRIGMQPEMVMQDGSKYLSGLVTQDVLQFVINAACRYSPWTATTSADGYITTRGGHRIGLCGEVTLRNGTMADVKRITSLCIRVARDFPGIGKRAAMTGSLLILGRPSSGKTTLLRDLIRIRSDGGEGSVAVVDERGELFPSYQGAACFPPGRRTDILSGCPKREGISLLLRTMGPATIAVDEITAQEDCAAVLQALWCGVDLLATAHAGSVADFMLRPVYKPLIESKVFTTALVMQPDKNWREEQLTI